MRGFWEGGYDSIFRKKEKSSDDVRFLRNILFFVGYIGGWGLKDGSPPLDDWKRRCWVDRTRRIGERGEREN